MHRDRILLAGRLVAIVASLVVGAAAEASPYIATRVGDLKDSYWDGSSATDRVTGASFAFAAPKTSVYADGLQRQWASGRSSGLPTSTAYQGRDYSNPVKYTMSLEQGNAAGTIVGRLPWEGSLSSDPMAYTSNYGYTVKQDDGSYSPFQVIGSKHTSSDSYGDTLMLSESNQILAGVAFDDVRGEAARLIDVATGTSTRVRDLVPPELMDRYAWGTPMAISGRGDLLVGLFGKVGTPDTPPDALYILTPQGLVAPAPVPEPSTLWLAAAVAAGLGLRSRLRRDG